MKTVVFYDSRYEDIHVVVCTNADGIMSDGRHIDDHVVEKFGELVNMERQSMESMIERNCEPEYYERYGMFDKEKIKKIFHANKGRYKFRDECEIVMSIAASTKI